MRAALATVVAALLLTPLTAFAQNPLASDPQNGPMTIERVHSGFLVAPDFKVTEVDKQTSVSRIVNTMLDARELIEAVTLDTPLFFTTASTTFWTYACLSSCDTEAGSFVIGVDQYSVYAGTAASFTSTFFATALALAMSAAMRVIRRISSSVTIGLLANPQTPL